MVALAEASGKRRRSWTGDGDQMEAETGAVVVLARRLESSKIFLRDNCSEINKNCNWASKVFRLETCLGVGMLDSRHCVNVTHITLFFFF